MAHEKAERELQMLHLGFLWAELVDDDSCLPPGGGELPPLGLCPPDRLERHRWRLIPHDPPPSVASPRRLGASVRPHGKGDGLAVERTQRLKGRRCEGRIELDVIVYCAGGCAAEACTEVVAWMTDWEASDEDESKAEIFSEPRYASCSSA